MPAVELKWCNHECVIEMNVMSEQRNSKCDYHRASIRKMGWDEA